MVKDNEPLSSLTHLIGAALAVAGTAVLVVFAALYSDARHVVGFAVFGASLILLYLASTLFHFLGAGKAKRVFERLDHALIYVLIAGTYTPICLIVLNGRLGWTLFGVIWGLAALGIIVKSAGIKVSQWISTAFYVVMGWLAVIAFLPLKAALPTAALWWLFGGGICYTVGALFFGFEETVYRRVPKHRWFGMHEVFHFFVLAGSACHFWLMLHYVLYIG